MIPERCAGTGPGGIDSSSARALEDRCPAGAEAHPLAPTAARRAATHTGFVHENDCPAVDDVLHRSQSREGVGVITFEEMVDLLTDRQGAGQRSGRSVKFVARSTTT